MTRNEKCALLRLIAKQIAENHDIMCLSAGCRQQVDCSGMCENLCAELEWLSSALGERYLCNDISPAGRNFLFLMGSLKDPGEFNINDLIRCSDGWPAEEIWPCEEQNEEDWGPEENLLCEETLADDPDDADT